jgi:hypothetical protein
MRSDSGPFHGGITVMQISRRAFASFLASIPFIGSVFAGSREDEVLDGLDPALTQIYRGYGVRWSGWKLTQKNDSAVGQWTAYPTTSKAPPWSPMDASRPYLYASTPGCYGSVLRGGTFDIVKRQGQVVVLSTTRPEIKDREMKKAGKILIRMIDVVMDSGKRNLTVLEWNDLLRRKRVL